MFFGRIRRRIRDRVLRRARSNEPAQEYTSETADLSNKDKHVASLALRALALETKQNELTKSDMMDLLYAIGLNPTEDIFEDKLRVMHIHTQETFTFGHFCFIWGLMQKDSIDEEDMLKKAFQFFDKDGNNEISINELKTTMHELGDLLSEAEIQEFVAHLDRDNNGVISYDEFIKELRSQVASMPSHSSQFDSRYSKSGKSHGVSLMGHNGVFSGNRSPTSFLRAPPAGLLNGLGDSGDRSADDPQSSDRTDVPGEALLLHATPSSIPGGVKQPSLTASIAAMQLELPSIAPVPTSRWQGAPSTSIDKEPSEEAHAQPRGEAGPVVSRTCSSNVAAAVELPGTPDYNQGTASVRTGSTINSPVARSDPQVLLVQADDAATSGDHNLRSPSHLDPTEASSRRGHSSSALQEHREHTASRRQPSTTNG